MEKIIGKHYAEPAEIRFQFDGEPYSTTSVGVCPVLAKSNKKPKLGAAVVRITGPCTEDGLKRMDRPAEIIARRLDTKIHSPGVDDMYTGPKTLSVDSFWAFQYFSIDDQQRREEAYFCLGNW
jgi:hypothetical protein